MQKIKEFLSKNEKVIWIIISILLTIGLNLSIYVVDNTIYFNNGNQIIWLFLCVFIYIVFKQANKYQKKRLKICSSILGILLSIFQVLGIMTNGNWIESEVILTKEIAIFMLVKFITYALLFYNIIKIVFSLIENMNWKSKSKDILKPNLKKFIVVALLLFIAWLPYFLNYYPGITSYDTHYQLMQGYKVSEYNNHHPVLDTFIVSSIVKVGYAIAGNYNFGIALYAILQMIFCAITLSFVIFYMGKKNVNPTIKIITFLAFAFVPVVPQFSIAVWKDVPFSMFMVWLLIGIIEMITNEENFFTKKRNMAFFILITLCVLFFRNNGIYIIILTLPFALFWKRKHWKKILVIFIIPIIIYVIITGPVYTMLNIKPSASKEMLSIPMQQMARIVKYKGDELSQEDKNLIGQYINIDTAAKLYTPTISDPIKNEFNDGTYNQDKLNLFKLYFKLALRFPGETLEAFVGNTYGYYYPEVVTYPLATGTYTPVFENEKFMEISEDPIVNIPILDSILDAIYKKQIPIVSLIANIGFVFWIVLGIVFYNIYQKRYKYLLMFVPVGVLYLTCLASPVSGELRYIYSMFVSLPLFIGVGLKKAIKQNKHI